MDQGEVDLDVSAVLDQELRRLKSRVHEGLVEGNTTEISNLFCLNMFRYKMRLSSFCFLLCVVVVCFSPRSC